MEMKITKPAYYAEVVKDLLKYREYKQRVFMILQDMDSKLENGMGIDYSKVSVQTSNCFDSTSQAALDRLDEETTDEFAHKSQLVKRVEIAYNGLDPVEKFIVGRKYMTGRVEVDKNIYTHHKFMYGRSKYYELKDDAVEKMARIMGYL